MGIRVTRILQNVFEGTCMWICFGFFFVGVCVRDRYGSLHSLRKSMPRERTYIPVKLMIGHVIYWYFVFEEYKWIHRIARQLEAPGYRNGLKVCDIFEV
jgi:hypothetical protein